MLRALLALCILVTVVDAAPKYPRAASTAPELAAAEKLWTTAAAETDLAKAPAAWEAAAAAFIRVVDTGTVAVAVRKEAANAAVLAWKNAIDVDPRITRAAPQTNQDFDRIPTPQPLDARDQALIHALDAYLTFSPAPDDAATAKFLRANVLRRRDQMDKAIAGFLDVLDHHRDHEVAEYAANLLLDSYNRLQRYEELIALATKLHADPKFLANKPDLAETVGRIYRIQAQNIATAEARRAKETGDLAYYERCGERYVTLLADPTMTGRDAEEARYNAAVCFQQAGSVARAVVLYRELIKSNPRSSLSGRSIARLGVAEASVAHYREALDALAQYSSMYAGEKDAADAASDAVFYAVALGDLVRAGRLAGYVTKTFGRKKPRLVVEVNLTVLDAVLAADRRSDVAPHAQVVASELWGQHLLEPDIAYRAGRLLADAACPVALVDELCVKPRDKRLIKPVRKLLADAQKGPRSGSMIDAAWVADHARRIELDLDLEGVLSTRAGGDAVARGYTDLIAATKQPEVRIAAHGRLGTLYRRLGDREQALRELRACVTEARATMAGSEWLTRCERDLTALREPDLDILPERFARPSAGPVLALEAPRLPR